MLQGRSEKNRGIDGLSTETKVTESEPSTQKEESILCSNDFVSFVRVLAERRVARGLLSAGALASTWRVGSTEFVKAVYKGFVKG